MSTQNFDFEKSITELEKIANMLENEQISLDESIALFQKGVELSKKCSTYLENAKQKIILLSKAQEESDKNDWFTA